MSEKEENNVEQEAVNNPEEVLKEDENVEATSTEEVEEVKEVTLEEKYDQLNDKYLRLYSDFDNFRKRTMKEKADLILNAGAGVLKEMLPVMDDFERAIAANENNEDAEGLKQGFELIFNKFSMTLQNKGLKPMNSKGEDFDTNLHEAITNIPAPSEDLKGKVVDVIEKGYFMNDKVVRFAKVVVGQ